MADCFQALERIFEVFGAFVQATIRHRIQDGKNTSWALVTMADTASVDKALVRSYSMIGLAISCRKTRFIA